MPDDGTFKEPQTTTDASNLNDKFSKIGKQLLNVAVDFTTINVTTLTGNYTHIINTKEQGGKFTVKTDFKNFTKELGKKGGVDAQIKLVAHTYVDFDADTVNFVSDEVNPNGDFLFDIHNASLTSAKTSRTAFIRMLKEFIP